jgi:prepilin-type N-terminal cleavage/methylation domain-containing protein
MNSSSYKTRSRKIRGFTLIELLTVIAIIGILAAILIPTVGAVRRQGKIAQSSSNLREISRALLMLAELNKGAFPYGDFDTSSTSPISYNYWKAERGVPSILYPKTATAQKATYGAWYGQHRPVIDGTVFSSPLRESDTDDKIGAISYGYNAEITNRNKPNLRLMELYPISKTILIADIFKTNRLTRGNLHARNGASSEYARDGKTLVGFIDGHIGSFSKAETDEINEGTSEKAKLAWGIQ